MEIDVGCWQDMCTALSIASDPRRYREARAQVSELIERSKVRGEAEGECIFRAQLYVLQDRLRVADQGPHVELLQHLDALSDAERLRLLRRYCTQCGGPITTTRCTCWKDD